MSETFKSQLPSELIGMTLEQMRTYFENNYRQALVDQIHPLHEKAMKILQAIEEAESAQFHSGS